jgi:hypothetical protein
VAPTAEPLPSAPPEAAPAPVEEKKPEYKITTGIGVRFGAQFTGLRRPATKVSNTGMSNFAVDEIYVEPRFSGQVLGFVGWTANLAVTGATATTAMGGTAPPPPMGPPVIFEARAMDLIAQFDFMDEFHLWGGRMLTPSDRSNFSGPWFMSPWDYPGLYLVPSHSGAPTYIGPRGTEEIGREVGAVAWGDIGKGKFKYYAGMMDLDDAPRNTPLYTARVSYDIIGAEPGFYGSSTYYGAQNVLAIGLAAQYQNRFDPLPGAVHADDLTEINADILGEFNIGDSGTISAEAAYYHVDSGKSAGVMPFDDAYFFVLSYLTPQIGPGKLQPLFRYQGAIDKKDAPAEDIKMSMIEGQVAYVLKDYFAKINLGFQATNMGKVSGLDATKNVKGNAIQFGFQIQQ